MFIKYRSNLISGGKGEGAAGIFEAWDMNSDRKITVDEVCKKHLIITANVTVSEFTHIS